MIEVTVNSATGTEKIYVEMIVINTAYGTEEIPEPEED